MQKPLSFLNSFLKKNDKIVIGVSGGPDSMCLLHILNSLKEKFNLQIIVAHVNHNVRSVSKKEEKFVQNYCKKINVIFESMTIESYGEDNFHNEARIIRYNFFEKLINKYKADYLMTAHHGDDLIETVLMRIVRGSTLRGYSGFDIVTNRDNYQIVKPLIYISREDINKYLEENNIKYCIDGSNLEDYYTRNRYRHHVLPFLKNEDDNIHEKFLKFHNTLDLHNEYFSKIVDQEMKKIYIDQKLNLKKLKNLDKLIQMKIIEELFHNIYNDDLFLINSEHMKLVLNVINKSGNTSIMLPKGMTAVKSYDYLTIEKGRKELTNYNIVLDEEVTLPNNKKISIIKECTLTNNYCTRIDSSEITLPLYIRTRQDGDKMAVKNLKGTKKINDIFVNEKINQKERNLWPIVVDSNNQIVWLPGLKKSYFDKEINEKYDIILWYY